MSETKKLSGQISTDVHCEAFGVRLISSIAMFCLTEHAVDFRSGNDHRSAPQYIASISCSAFPPFSLLPFLSSPTLTAACAPSLSFLLNELNRTVPVASLTANMNQLSIRPFIPIQLHVVKGLGSHPPASRLNRTRTICALHILFAMPAKKELHYPNKLWGMAASLSLYKILRTQTAASLFKVVAITSLQRGVG
jgi:hypothetical protein